MPDSTPLVPRPSGSASLAHPPSARPFAHWHAYTQITLTYLRRKMFWISGAILFAMLIGLTVHALRYTPPAAVAPVSPLTPEAIESLRRSSLTPAAIDGIIKSYGEYIDSRTAAGTIAVTLFIFGQICALFTILAHLKEQIASPRATLIPLYRRPHMIVAAAFALPLLLLYPLAISFSFRLSPTGVLAVSTTFSALVLWYFYLPKWPLIAVVGLLYFGSFSEQGRRALHAALASTALPQNLLVIALSLAAIIALARRLMTLHEEMPEYARPIIQWRNLAVAHPTQAAAPQINYKNPLSLFIMSPSSRQLSRLAQSPPSSAMDRVKRWQLAGNFPHSPWIFSPVILLLAILMKYSGSVKDVQALLVPLALFPTPLFVQAALTAWPTLGVESLRPNTRDAFIRQRAAALALFVFQIWLSLAVTLLVSVALLLPASLAKPTFWLTLTATLLLQFPAFATSIWILRFRSPLALAACVGVFTALGAFAATLCTDHAPISIPIPGLAAIFLAILLASALLLRDAYHRWLRTDLA